MGNKGIYRFKEFSLDILKLIAMGEKENIETIEREINDGNITRYIYDKYKNKINKPDYLNEDQSIYNLDKWNNRLRENNSSLNGLEEASYHITKDDDGLLLLLAVLIEELKDY